MTKEEKKNKFDRTAYMREYMRDYTKTDEGKKKKQEINANYQKSEKGKETRKKWLAKNLRVSKSLPKNIVRRTNGKKRKSVQLRKSLS